MRIGKILTQRLRKFTLASSFVALCAVAGLSGSVQHTEAAGETRTLSMVFMNTNEKLTITYMKNGRYIPSAMTRINHFLRDWRANEVTTMDPRTIDLMWELHADLGSKQAIRIVSGYRSPKTNGMLKRIGRNVAKKSQHMVGRAIDMYFPDVPLSRIRASAIVRKVGGVGYYPAGDGGFVHIDSGNVRYWPRPSENQLAQIFRDYKTTIGARMRNPSSMLAMQEVPSTPDIAVPTTPKKPQLDNARLANLAEEEAKLTLASVAPTSPVLPAPKPDVASLNLAPTKQIMTLPKPRPQSIIAAAAKREKDMQIALANSEPITATASLLPQLRVSVDAMGATSATNKTAKSEPISPQVIRLASLSPAELNALYQSMQDQDARDDELQDSATQGGPMINFMSKQDRLQPSDLTNLISRPLQAQAMRDPLAAGDEPIPFN